ncbi:MAG: hypothetical protein ACKOWF_01550 [Chloroflexota bacterium]
MDQSSFDRIARLLGSRTNRRIGLPALIGVFWPAVAAPGDAVAARRKRPAAANPGGENSRAAHEPFPEGPCGDGSSAANKCRKHADCCTRYCKKGAPGRAGRCRCVKIGKRCKKRQTCCGGAACMNGTCQRTAATCPPGTCPSLTPICSAGACVSGQWVAKEVLGASQPATGTAIDDFNYPIDSAMTSDGLELYVADDPNFRIAVWTRASVTAAWQAQTPLGNGQGVADNQFAGPIGVALSADGLTLYVSDAPNNRIAVWTRTAVGAAWQAQPPIAAGQLNGPSRLCHSADGLTLYIANTDGHEIAVWARASLTAAYQAQPPVGSGPGTSSSQLTYPGGVAVTADGLEMYIGDTANNRVAVWTRATQAATWAAQSPLGNGQGSANDQFSAPNKVVLANDGLTMFVADSSNNRIAIWTRATPAAPWAAQPPIGSGPGSATAQLNNPIGMSLSSDYLWLAIADNSNSRVAIWHYE